MEQATQTTNIEKLRASFARLNTLVHDTERVIATTFQGDTKTNPLKKKTLNSLIAIFDTTRSQVRELDKLIRGEASIDDAPNILQRLTFEASQLELRVEALPAKLDNESGKPVNINVFRIEARRYLRDIFDTLEAMHIKPETHLSPEPLLKSVATFIDRLDEVLQEVAPEGGGDSLYTTAYEGVDSAYIDDGKDDDELEDELEDEPFYDRLRACLEKLRAAHQNAVDNIDQMNKPGPTYIHQFRKPLMRDLLCSIHSAYEELDNQRGLEDVEDQAKQLIDEIVQNPDRHRG